MRSPKQTKKSANDSRLSSARVSEEPIRQRKKTTPPNLSDGASHRKGSMISNVARSYGKRAEKSHSAPQHSTLQRSPQPLPEDLPDGMRQMLEKLRQPFADFEKSPIGVTSRRPGRLKLNFAKPAAGAIVKDGIVEYYDHDGNKLREKPLSEVDISGVSENDDTKELEKINERFEGLHFLVGHDDVLKEVVKAFGWKKTGGSGGSGSNRSFVRGGFGRVGGRKGGGGR
ncbi:MAG: hypothetical protein AAGD25_08395 [Cyanobacteria bacterium P01_F01_bin.150]